VKTKIAASLQLFLRLGVLFRPRKAKTGRNETDLPALLHLNPWLESSEQSLIAKKVAKKSRFLLLDSRSSFNMTIWSGRTQRSIASGFTADPVGGNRILHSMVLDARPTGAVALPPPQSAKRKPCALGYFTE